MGLAALADEYLYGRESRAELRPFTLRNYRVALRRLVAVVGDRPVTELDGHLMFRWFESLRHHSASTRCNHYSAVSGFCRWLRRQQLVEVDLLGDIQPPRRPRHLPRYVPAAMVGRLVEACPDARARAIVFVMVGMGLRCQEVAGLEMADWDRAAGIMLVREGKGGFEREVPVPTLTEVALDAYLAEHPVSMGPLFRSYRDRGLGLSGHAMIDLRRRQMPICVGSSWLGCGLRWRVAGTRRRLRSWDSCRPGRSWSCPGPWPRHIQGRNRDVKKDRTMTALAPVRGEDGAVIAPAPGQCNACWLFACGHCELPSRCSCPKCHPIRAPFVVDLSASAPAYPLRSQPARSDQHRAGLVPGEIREHV